MAKSLPTTEIAGRHTRSSPAWLRRARSRTLPWSNVETLGKVLLGIGFVLVAGGLAFLLLSRFGVRRLPGDIVVRRGNFTLYAPIGLMIVLSLLLTIALNLFSRK